MDLQILIPSRSRPSTMVTPYKIPKKYREITTVFVAEEQLQEYRKHHSGGDYGFSIKSVSNLNDLLGQKLFLMTQDAKSEYVLLCDDDFTFFKRKQADMPQLVAMEDHDWDILFHEVNKLFTDDSRLYGVGISMRQGNNRLLPEGNRNTRLNGCIIYKRDIFLAAEHDRVNPMNDFDVNLQLLRQGYNNHLISQYCYNQPGTQSPGGSSDYRTEETQAKAAHRLAELHPGFVSIRKKQNKTGGLRERTEVTVQWKKARESYENQ